MLSHSVTDEAIQHEQISPLDAEQHENGMRPVRAALGPAVGVSHVSTHRDTHRMLGFPIAPYSAGAALDAGLRRPACAAIHRQIT